MKKKPDKVLEMKLVPAAALNDILYDFTTLQDLLSAIANPEEPSNAVNGIHYFLASTTRKLDELTTHGYDVRWTI